MPAFKSFTLILLVSVLAAISCAGNEPQAVAPMVEQKPQVKTTDFDGERALAHVRALVEIGPRPSGSAGNEKAGRYIARELKSYGLRTSIDEFSPATPKGKVKMRNIIAEIPGESTDVVMIGSHYDSKHFSDFRFVGANDSGSSTGALLEIARVLATDAAAGKFKPRFTWQFVFLDGEEAFCAGWSDCMDGKDNLYGSRQMVARLRREKRLDKTRAFILLDMIGDKNLAIPKELNSSGWLVESIWSTARETGHGEFFTNDTHYITDDHVPFLEAGISSVDLIDFDYGDDERDFWHTADDTLDKLSARSLKIVGDVLILSLPRIEAQIR